MQSAIPKSLNFYKMESNPRMAKGASVKMLENS